METEGLIFQLRAEISPQDAWLKKIVGHDFSEPLVTYIGEYKFEIQKLYSRNACEPTCPEIPPPGDGATEKEVELYNLDQKMRRAYTAVSLDNDKQAVYLVIKLLSGLESVEYAQYDGLNVFDSPPLSRELCPARGIDIIKAPDVWHISQGDNVVVGVIDSGVYYDHPDLKNNIFSLRGYDFSDCDDDPKPRDDHGTHCSGTIAADGVLYSDISGVAPKAKIMALKVKPKALDSVCARAIKYAACSGAKVLNNSWEPLDVKPLNQTLEQAVDYAYLKNCIVVFAAGNKKKNVSNFSPANYHLRVISVAATTCFDNRADFSNFGQLITVAAPGVDIESLIEMSGRGFLSGTSMACAHVSGVVALMLKKNPGLSFEQIKLIISDIGNSEPTTGFDTAVRRINAYKSVVAA